MTKNTAETAADSFRSEVWSVTARPSPIASRGWELVGEAADGGRPVYAFSPRDMAALVVYGQVAKRK